MAVLDGLARLPARNRLGLGLALAFMIALSTATWLWSRMPDWRVVYSNLSDRDGGAIVAQLSQMNIPYRIAEGGGAIMVPAAQVHDVRLRLASQGLPKGSIVGFERLESQKLGATQFQEQVNYQRGLEGELARTIQTLATVQSARVHLAIPKSSPFLRERQKPSASVVLTLHPGRAIDRAQIAGLVHLVASSVPELPAKNVTVIDQNGALLSQPGDGPVTGLDARQLSYVQEVEAAYIKRIHDILEPIVGRGNVRAQVSAEIDFTLAESTAETFKPNQDSKEAAVRSQVTAEASEGGAARAAAGIPGAASNAPGGAAASNGSAGALGSQKRDATVNYELDKTVRVVRHQSGAVKRLSAAVVVNHRRTVAGDRVSLAPLKEEEISQLNALVREAIGLSKDRGDTLNLVNAAFNVEPPAATSEVPPWKDPELTALAFEGGKHLGAALLLLLVTFGVLRPALRSLATAPPLPEPAAGGSEAAAPALPGATTDPLEAARQLASQDPKVVASVVKGWVSKEG